jgi:hypothetical protein
MFKAFMVMNIQVMVFCVVAGYQYFKGSFYLHLWVNWTLPTACTPCNGLFISTILLGLLLAHMDTNLSYTS